MAESKKPGLPPGKLKSRSQVTIAAEDSKAIIGHASSVSFESTEGGDVDQIGKGVAKGPVAIDREEYLLAHRELLFDKKQAQVKNNILHRRLAEYYKKRKLDHVLKPIESTADLDESYHQKLFSYEELKEKSEREAIDLKNQVEIVQLQYEERLEHADKKFYGLQNHEKSTGAGLIYSKKGKPIADKTVQRFLHLQMRKTEQLSALWLRYIRARNAVGELETIIKKLEKIGPGLYVAHYEQLLMDHANYLTKIEERDEELIKNRNKCTNYNVMLAHIREKMNHTDEVIDTTECDLGDAEIEYQRAREDLGMIKTRRDRLRWSLETERRKAGLLMRKDLLRDFQDSQSQVEKLREKKEHFQYQINKANLQLRDARRCLKMAKMEAANARAAADAADRLPDDEEYKNLGNS